MPSFVSVIAILCLTILPAGGSAQAVVATGTPAANKQVSETPIDRWLSKPTAIEITPDQRKKVDSIKVAYAADVNRAVTEERGNGEMAIVVRMGQLANVYRRIVRSVLTPTQQTIFDKNLAADRMAP